MISKIPDIIVDIVLIAVVFAITDILMFNVFHSENILFEVLVYIVIYGIIFGGKCLICRGLKKIKIRDNNNNEQ